MIGTKWELYRETNPWYQTRMATESDFIEAGDTTLLEGFESLKKFDTTDILLGLDKEKNKIYLNQKYFANFRRVDGTKGVDADLQTIGRWIDLDFKRLTPDVLAMFLIESQIITTYAHVGSTLEVTRKQETEEKYLLRIEGEHEYYTNKRYTARIDFTICIDKTDGLVSLLSGRSLSKIPTEPELKK